MKYYLLDENKNLVEGFDKEGFLALLEQAIEEGSLDNIDEDSAVASKIRSVLNGTTHHLEFVTQAQYNQLEADGELVANTYYFITDDTSYEDIDHLLKTHTNTLEDHEEKLTDHEERLITQEARQITAEIGEYYIQFSDVNPYQLLIEEPEKFERRIYAEYTVQTGTYQGNTYPVMLWYDNSNEWWRANYIDSNGEINPLSRNITGAEVVVYYYKLPDEINL